MTKNNTTLMFVKSYGTLGGSALEKAIKDFARTEFDDTIIDESQVDNVVETLRDHANSQLNLHTRWKDVSIKSVRSRSDELGLATMYWIVVDEETILVIKRARCNYAPF